MADPSGRKDSDGPAAGLLFAAGRMVGFLALAGTALAIIAGMVLLPAYAKMRYARYERDCQKVALAEMEATAAANARLIADMPSSPVLTKRLAMSQGELVPDKEVIAPATRATRPPPDVILPVRYPRPDPPEGWLLTAAAKLQNPPTRRGLLLLATGSLLVALFLFAPPQPRPRT